MNIIIDIRCLMDKNYSGVSYYTLNLLRAIFSRDSSNNYFLFYNSGSDVAANMPKFDYPNVHIVSVRYPNKLFNFALKLGIIKLDKLILKKWKMPACRRGREHRKWKNSGGKKHFQFSIINSPFSIDLFFAPAFNFISLSKGCPLMLTAHDLSFEMYPEFFALKNYPWLWFLNAKLWYKYVNTKKLCQRAKKIIAVSENTKRDIIKFYGIESNKVNVVYPGIENCESNSQPQTANCQLPTASYIFYVGNLEPRKNIDSLLLAFDKLREEVSGVKLVIAGADAWRYQNIYKVWQEMKYKNDVEFKGYVSQEEKSELLKNAQVFAYPSYYEGFGFPPLEAQSVGAPVLTSAHSSLAEIIGSSGLLVDPYNINEIKEGLKVLLTDEKLREDFIQKGYENVQRFNWNEAGRKVIDILSS